jgi:aspartyl-tRNA(Asn)/glutamyl-tRNA(Gln) amidotransferase subunit A
MIHTLNLGELSCKIARREISATQVIDAFLQRIDQLDGKLHAFVEVYADSARQAARAADEMMAAGYYLGPLHGIPVALKDIIDIQGKATTCGSLIYADQLASKSADIVQRLTQAGAIIIGKTHMVQFAMGAWGPNEYMGTPRNPWDDTVHRIPGGSSSGSAVAVAARLAPVAIGTDTGGSVRVPASYCGITGLKPTVGKLDTTGVMQLSQTLDSLGVFTHTAADARLVYQLLSDPQAVPSCAVPCRGLVGMRIARLNDSYLQHVQPEMRTAYESSLDTLQDLGAEIVSIDLPASLDEFKGITGSIMMSEGAFSFEKEITNPQAPVDTSVRPRLLAGLEISAKEYLAARRQRDLWKAELEKTLAGISAFVTPTTLTTAVPLSEVDHGNAPVQFTRIGNLLELCGIAIPNGVDAQGLPTSLQIMCRGGDEEQALLIAMAYQSTTDWHTLTP